MPPTPTHEEGKGTLTTHPCTPGRYKCHPHLHTRMVQGQGTLVPHSFTPGWYRAPLPPTSAHQKGTAFVNFVLLSMCYVSGHHRAPPDGDALGDRLYIYGLCSCHRPLHTRKGHGALTANPCPTGRYRVAFPPTPRHQLGKGRPCYPALHTRKEQGGLATHPYTPVRQRAPLPHTPTHQLGKGRPYHPPLHTS